VTVEADLEDHVLVVVTLKAEGLWGGESTVSQDSGAGTAGWTAVNKGWDVGINEAYLQLNQVFFTPATVKIGRQYLNYGRGLILSSYDGEYNFDAARLVLDYYPVTVDVVGAMLVNNQSFQPFPDNDGSANLLLANIRYELADSILKDVELYGGWIAQGSSGPISTQYLPTFGAASPWIVGLRGDLNLTKSLQTWFEAAYEGGADGFVGDSTISAYMFNVGAKFTMADTKMTPTLNASYTYASGGGDDYQNYFRPWFDTVEGYNGYMLKPVLSNIQIINVGASIKPANNCTLGIQGYWYLKAGDRDGVVFTNPNIDAGYGYPIFSNSREIGYGIDTTLGYDYSKDVRCQIVYGVFIPSKIHDSSSVSEFDAVSHGVRGEVNVKF
jgi:hypothetical protein